ncbi:MAG: hypothetical protein COV45_01530 [Deltaproteobacteria bacterium CG11_big_fil_rev_8_21_14_0_20_47_16]|nr:MAG: hypothetical protein COV45_01530 [Deltaproteobacteria bacterium CG11_big_fil_rev_8_21_14_0_20_47_16]
MRPINLNTLQRTAEWGFLSNKDRQTLFTLAGHNRQLDEDELGFQSLLKLSPRAAALLWRVSLNDPKSLNYWANRFAFLPLHMANGIMAYFDVEHIKTLANYYFVNKRTNDFNHVIYGIPQTGLSFLYGAQFLNNRKMKAAIHNALNGYNRDPQVRQYWCKAEFDPTGTQPNICPLEKANHGVAAVDNIASFKARIHQWLVDSPDPNIGSMQISKTAYALLRNALAAYYTDGYEAARQAIHLSPAYDDETANELNRTIEYHYLMMRIRIGKGEYEYVPNEIDSIRDEDGIEFITPNAQNQALMNRIEVLRRIMKDLPKE